jgi:hypothetical protein
MPPISFTPTDLLRGKIVTPAWYVMRIESIEEKLSKDQQSTNYVVEGKIIKNADDGSEEFANVPVTWNFNSKALGFAVGYLESLGITVEAGKRYDLPATAGKFVEVFVENDLYEGRTLNRVNHKYRALRDSESV